MIGLVGYEFGHVFRLKKKGGTGNSQDYWAESFDPHVITRGTYKGRIAYFGREIDGPPEDFFRLYRRSKYLDVETLRRFHFGPRPISLYESQSDYERHVDARDQRHAEILRNRYVENIEKYGADAIAHLCPNYGFLRYGRASIWKKKVQATFRTARSESEALLDVCDDFRQWREFEQWAEQPAGKPSLRCFNSGTRRSAPRAP